MNIINKPGGILQINNGHKHHQCDCDPEPNPGDGNNCECPEGGIPGPAGPQGPKGDKGDPGVSGPKGDSGVAYNFSFDPEPIGRDMTDGNRIIYRKLVNCGKLPNSTWKDFPTNITGIRSSWVIGGYGISDTGNQCWPIPYVAPINTGITALMLDRKQGIIRLQTVIDRSEITAFVIIAYTLENDDSSTSF